MMGHRSVWSEISFDNGGSWGWADIDVSPKGKWMGNSRINFGVTIG